MDRIDSAVSCGCASHALPACSGVRRQPLDHSMIALSWITRCLSADFDIKKVGKFIGILYY